MIPTQEGPLTGTCSAWLRLALWRGGAGGRPWNVYKDISALWESICDQLVFSKFDLELKWDIDVNSSLMCFLVCVSLFYIVDKAQEVEAELLESHQEETSQLYKKIAEKEDDLQRTAKRYEEILDVLYFLSLFWNLTVIDFMVVLKIGLSDSLFF